MRLMLQIGIMREGALYTTPLSPWKGAVGEADWGCSYG